MPVIFGIISGIITGLGMGGGTVLILFLSLFMNLDQHVAQATNLIFFIPTSIAAIIINLKNKNIDMSVAKLVIVFGIAGTVIGALTSQMLDSLILKKYFAIFILGIVIYEIYRLVKEYRIERIRHNKNKREEEEI